MTNIACNGTCDGSAVATVSGGVGPYSYLWSNGDSSSTATNLCTGSYTVNVEDANGCTGTSSVTITQGGLTTSVTGRDVVCNGYVQWISNSNGSWGSKYLIAIYGIQGPPHPRSIIYVLAAIQ